MSNYAMIIWPGLGNPAKTNESGISRPRTDAKIPLAAVSTWQSINNINLISNIFQLMYPGFMAVEGQEPGKMDFIHSRILLGVVIKNSAIFMPFPE